MRIYQIDAMRLSSLSVNPDEICAVELDPGDVLYCRGKRIEYDKPTVAIVDRLRGQHCTMIRQELACPYSDWGQDWAEPCKEARTWAKEHDAPRVTVPGGIPPLTIEGTIAVPDFSMSGTSWYIVTLI